MPRAGGIGSRWGDRGLALGLVVSQVARKQHHCSNIYTIVESKRTMNIATFQHYQCCGRAMGCTFDGPFHVVEEHELTCKFANKGKADDSKAIKVCVLSCSTTRMVFNCLNWKGLRAQGVGLRSR